MPRQQQGAHAPIHCDRSPGFTDAKGVDIARLQRIGHQRRGNGADLDIVDAQLRTLGPVAQQDHMHRKGKRHAEHQLAGPGLVQGLRRGPCIPEVEVKTLVAQRLFKGASDADHIAIDRQHRNGRDRIGHAAQPQTHRDRQGREHMRRVDPTETKHVTHRGP